MKKIYIFSFLGGLLLGQMGLWGGLLGGLLDGFYSSLAWGTFEDYQKYIPIVSYFATLFLVWFLFSLFFKNKLHLDKKKHRIMLFAGLVGISITASLFVLLKI